MENKIEATQEQLNNMAVRNPELTKDGNLLCEVNHPEYGWIPFLATPYDVEEHGRKIFERIPKEFKAIPQMVEEEPVVESGPTIQEVLQQITERLDKLEKRVK